MQETLHRNYERCRDTHVPIRCSRPIPLQSSTVLVLQLNFRRSARRLPGLMTPLLLLGGVHALTPLLAPTLTPRSPARVVRHARLPVWPAWQGLALGVAGQVPGLRGVADFLEDKFGGRVCPMSLDASDCDPFILLVHHRHAFRPLDFLRPLFSAIIMPEGFPAHPHRSRVNTRGPAAARTATRRSRSPPACSGPALWAQEERPRERLAAVPKRG